MKLSEKAIRVLRVASGKLPNNGLGLSFYDYRNDGRVVNPLMRKGLLKTYESPLSGQPYYQLTDEGQKALEAALAAAAPK